MSLLSNAACHLRLAQRAAHRAFASSLPFLMGRADQMTPFQSLRGNCCVVAGKGACIAGLKAICDGMTDGDCTCNKRQRSTKVQRWRDT